MYYHIKLSLELLNYQQVPDIHYSYSQSNNPMMDM